MRPSWSAHNAWHVLLQPSAHNAIRVGSAKLVLTLCVLQIAYTDHQLAGCGAAGLQHSWRCLQCFAQHIRQQGFTPVCEQRCPQQPCWAGAEGCSGWWAVHCLIKLHYLSQLGLWHYDTQGHHHRRDPEACGGCRCAGLFHSTASTGTNCVNEQCRAFRLRKLRDGSNLRFKAPWTPIPASWLFPLISAAPLGLQQAQILMYCLTCRRYTPCWDYGHEEGRHDRPVTGQPVRGTAGGAQQPCRVCGLPASHWHYSRWCRPWLPPTLEQQEL